MSEIIGRIGPQGIEQNSPRTVESNIETPEESSEGNIDNAEKPEVDEVAEQQLRNEIKQKVEIAEDSSICLDILRQHLNDPEMLSWAIQTTHKSLVEKFGNSAPSVETLSEIAKLMQHLESSISAEDLEVLSEMAKDPKFEGLQEKKNRIINALCMPIIRGHLTGDDIKNLVQRIALMPRGRTGSTRTSHGYEGIMAYDHESGTILINPDVFERIYQGRLILDLEKTATHELAHGVVEKSQTDKEHGKNFEALVAKANEIIGSAAEIKDSQSKHIRTVLEGVLRIDQDYAELPDPKPSSDQFRNQRLVSAANEIITDYTAMYLLSDGSFKDFARVCLEKTNKQGFEQYLAQAMNISVGTDEEKSRLVSHNLSQIKADLASGQTISTILEKNPGMQNLVEIYKVFYENINPTVSESKGQFSGLEESEEEDYDEGSFADSADGFEQEDRSDMQQGSKFDVLGLVDAFASEVETVAKPIANTPEGGAIPNAA